MTDERQGRPSASKMERLYLCPGSWQFEQRLRAEGNLAPEGEDAARDTGDRVHALISGSEPFELAEESERGLVQQAWDMERRLREKVFGEAQNDNFAELREVRLWQYETDLPQTKPIQSAKVDYACYDTIRDRGLVIDYKTGWGDHEESDRNIQIAAQVAALSFQHSSIDEWHAFLYQPRAGEPVHVVYKGGDIEKVQRFVEQIVREAEQPDAPLIPGEKQCRYCPARHVCVEAHQNTMALAVTDTAALSKERMPDLLDAVSIAKRVIPAVEAKAKEMLAEDPDSIPGWRLKEGATQRTVTDAEEAFRSLPVEMTQERFLECVSVQIGKLEKELATASNMKQADAKREVARRLGHVIEEKPKAPSLERVKEEG